jgi:ABC-2 type transport system ATP-binding protein
MYSIKISHLKKYFGTVKAVDDISIDIKEGEIFGFLGPNGAGKTTTIGCMLNLLKPNEGTILLDGKDISEKDTEIKKKLSFIPSDPYFYPNWTGKEHIEFVKRVKGDTPLLNNLVNDFSFDFKRKVGELSTGNKQKLAIIIAMMCVPKILIMDEPTRGLDPLLQNTFYKYIQRLNDQGTTIFMSSHNLPEVESICSQVAIIKGGKLIEAGDVKTLQDKNVHIITIELERNQKVDMTFVDKYPIQILNQYDHRIELKVTGDITPVLQQISKLNIRDITIEHANLEEIFLEAYRQ